MNNYQIDGLTIRTPKREIPFVTWANVWLLAQTLIVIYALWTTIQMPIKALVVAVAGVWLIYQTNKF